jgi:hypothetical protein
MEHVIIYKIQIVCVVDVLHLETYDGTLKFPPTVYAITISHSCSLTSCLCLCKIEVQSSKTSDTTIKLARPTQKFPLILSGMPSVNKIIEIIYFINIVLFYTIFIIFILVRQRTNTLVLCRTGKM